MDKQHNRLHFIQLNLFRFINQKSFILKKKPSANNTLAYKSSKSFLVFQPLQPGINQTEEQIQVILAAYLPIQTLSQ